MLRIEHRHPEQSEATLTLTLPFDQRQKSRLRARLDSGEEVAIQLERGSQLSHGERLQTTCGKVVLVQGAKERLSSVQSTDLHALTRAAYHLGNRHVALQIRAGCLHYLHDHVLDAMLRQLGLEVTIVEQPFEPESGAYGTGHAHAVHSHGHSHARVHANSPVVGVVRPTRSEDRREEP